MTIRDLQAQIMALVEVRNEINEKISDISDTIKRIEKENQPAGSAGLELMKGVRG